MREVLPALLASYERGEPAAMATATCSAASVPLKESGAITTRTMDRSELPIMASE